MATCNVPQSPRARPITDDELIQALGSKLIELIHDYETFDELTLKADHDNHHLEKRSNDTYRRISNICDAIASLPANSLESALIQTRAIAFFDGLPDSPEGDARTERLLASISAVLESRTALSHAAYGGNWFMCPVDPFERPRRVA